MPYRREPLAAGQVFHVYNRGVAKQRIFFSEGNYRFFLVRAKACLEPHAEIIAYCLMPNHYHFIVETKDDKLSDGMKDLCGAYTRAINKRLARVGPLCEARFKSKRVDSDVYLKHLSRYVHKNPVEAGLVKHPEDWVHSSFREYLSQYRSGLINPERVLSQFDDKAAYVRFMTAADVIPPPDLHRILFDDAGDDAPIIGRNDLG
jgi:REP element-mobilizing transposase RayT